MKPFFYLIFLFSFSLNAQSLDELSYKILQLDESLLEKHTAKLYLILHENVSVTHSNGFTEDKSKIIENTASSFIKYAKIEQKNDSEFVKIDDNSYIVYRFIKVSGIYDIYDFSIDLRLMEVWIWEENRWQLLGRQSLQINKN
ncbi:nuclear transport factor 2 family protein [Moheibacter sediminis]|uniref:DUF4440 domain-containing protein n=1 Tax=Moheibacter sediminis TaxID=1434700 RepID=A0A1W2B4I0_9FLAO|nr:nuclear transport factor 2 family protein [Moheibacter sediminis]SMC67836.1 protein of unknown function [Moheibacter sediminis]